MRRRDQYILFALIGCIIYLVFLIMRYMYDDFQTSAYIQTIMDENIRAKELIAERESDHAYIQTNAYIDYVMKASQNKKDPSEEVVFIVDKSDITNNQPLDVMKTISTNTPQLSSGNLTTAGMTREEKWQYYLFGIVK